MTPVEIIFGLIVPIIMATIALILFSWELYLYWRSGKPVKNASEMRKKMIISKTKPEDDYLVVCRTKKYAMELRKRLLNSISGCYPPNGIKVINNYGKFICLYFTRTHTVVRFISEAGYFEASRGFRGWIVEEHQLEEWLEATETKED